MLSNGGGRSRLVLRCEAAPAPLYEQLAQYSVFTVKAGTIGVFPGSKVDPKLAQKKKHL